MVDWPTLSEHLELSQSCDRCLAKVLAGRLSVSILEYEASDGILRFPLC